MYFSVASRFIDGKNVEATLVGKFTTEVGFSITLKQSREVFLKGGLGGVVIYGDRWSFHADRDGYVLSDGNGRGAHQVWPTSELSDYALEIEAFADACAGDAWGAATAAFKLRSLAVVVAGFESVEWQELVRLSERYGDI